MRLLTYILVGIGAAIAVLALAVVFFDDGGPDAVEPQADNGQSVTATASNAGGSPADQQTAADTSDNPQQGNNTGQSSGEDAQIGESAFNRQSMTATASNAGGSPADQQTAADTSDNPQQGNNTGQSSGEDAQIGESALEIDLAQVRSDGQAVFAGRAEPLAEVTIFEGDVILGKTIANDDGEWVVVLERPLGPGEHLVSVGTKSPSGETDIANLTLAIKVGDTEYERPLVALLPPSEMTFPNCCNRLTTRPKPLLWSKRRPGLMQMVRSRGPGKSMSRRRQDSPSNRQPTCRSSPRWRRGPCTGRQIASLQLTGSRVAGCALLPRLQGGTLANRLLSKAAPGVSWASWMPAVRAE